MNVSSSRLSLGIVCVLFICAGQNAFAMGWLGRKVAVAATAFCLARICTDHDLSFAALGPRGVGALPSDLNQNMLAATVEPVPATMNLGTINFDQLSKELGEVLPTEDEGIALGRDESLLTASGVQVEFEKDGSVRFVVPGNLEFSALRWYPLAKTADGKLLKTDFPAAQTFARGLERSIPSKGDLTTLMSILRDDKGNYSPFVFEHGKPTQREILEGLSSAWVWSSTERDIDYSYKFNGEIGKVNADYFLSDNAVLTTGMW